MSNDRLKYLLEQYALDRSTADEVRELFNWIRRSKNDAPLEQKIRELWAGQDSHRELSDVNWDQIYSKITNTPVRLTGRRGWWKYAAAAVIAAAVSVGGYRMLQGGAEKTIASAEPAHHIQEEIKPGGNRALLTLADGKQIILDSAGNGTLSDQGSVQVIKLGDGQLSYKFSDNSSNNNRDGRVLYNTISTPRGGQYQIVLVDGTKVWLNASSSLRFSATFPGSERNVELKGEGYFEVARNEQKPFNVSVNGMTVRVLGTHFNVNAYDDDSSVKTTLLDGSVEIEKDGKSKKIVPGEQARIGNSGSSSSDITVQNVNVEDAIAWKDGRFIFHDDNIQSVMKQLARWYDVTVSYEGDITNEEFVGVINRSRYENIFDILNMLERTRTVSFTVTGHHVTVKPYIPALSDR